MMKEQGIPVPEEIKAIFQEVERIVNEKGERSLEGGFKIVDLTQPPIQDVVDLIN